MASPLTPTPAPPTTSVNGPDPTDPRTALSVRAPLTQILGFVIWLYNVLAGITGGVAVHLLYTLTVDGAATFTNSLTAFSIDTGSLRYGARTFAGAVTTGTTTYNPTSYQNVYVDPATSIAGGVIWQCASGTFKQGETMHFTNLSASAAIQIKDDAGTIIAALRNGSGMYAVDVSYLSGAWVVTDALYNYGP